MKKYKYISRINVGVTMYPQFGNIYSEDYTWGNGRYSVGELAEMYPSSWKEIEDEPEVLHEETDHTKAVTLMKGLADSMNGNNKILKTANKLKEMGGLLDSYVKHKSKAEKAKRRIESLSKELELNIKL